MNLFAALLDGIVKSSPVMEIQEVADSSLTCILGRESAYSGKELEFSFLANDAKHKLRPEGIDEGPKAGPVELPFPDVRKPGTPLPKGVCDFISTVEHFTGATVISIGNGPEGPNIIYVK